MAKYYDEHGWGRYGDLRTHEVQYLLYNSTSHYVIVKDIYYRAFASLYFRCVILLPFGGSTISSIVQSFGNFNCDYYWLTFSMHLNIGLVFCVNWCKY
jgi:hypothetical protein